MSMTFDLGPTPLPGALKGRLSLAMDRHGALPRLLVSCVEGSWEGAYADLGATDAAAEPLADWQIYVCARPHNRPVASAVFASGLFDLTGRCTGHGRAVAYIWRLRPSMLDPRVRAELARCAGWRHAPAASVAIPEFRAAAQAGWDAAWPRCGALRMA